MATGRATAGGSLISMQRPGRASVAAGSSVTAVSGAAAILGLPVAVVTPALKIGQVAMDPWAEVDTWLGYGEEFGEEENLFYETDVMLEDDFNEGLAGAVGTPVDALYGTDAQNPQQSGVSKLGTRNDEDVGPLRVDRTLVGPEVRKQGSPLGSEAQEIEEAQVCVVAPNPSCSEEALQIDGPYSELNPSAASVATQAAVSLNDAGELPTKEGVRPTSRLFPSENISEAGVAMAEMQPAHIDADVGSGISERKEPSNPGKQAEGKLPDLGAPAAAMATAAFPPTAGSESDSDGPLPDIVDGDPDSD